MKYPAIVRHPLFSPLLLLTCSFLLYLPTFGGTWIMDDYSVIVNNPDIRSISNFILNRFPGRPLREVSYLLDYSLFGLDPWGYHFQNIFWHGLNCWLLYRLAIRLTLSPCVAWLTSLLFLLHPIHVEVVANSSHRKDSLALAFLLMALLAYMKISEQALLLRRYLWLAGSFMLWLTAFFAKGNSLVFPVIIMAYEYALVPQEKRLLIRWQRMMPILYALSGAGIIVWYFYIATLPSFKMAIVGAFVKTDNLASFSITAYILMVLKSFSFMVSKLIMPIELSMEYIYSAPTSILDPWVVSALVLIPVAFAMAYRWRIMHPHRYFLLLLSAILWIPTANVLWHFSYFAADRYMYAPSAGLCMLTALATEQGLTRHRKIFLLGWLTVLLTCAVLTWKQTGVWQNEKSLYSKMLEVSPRSLEAMIGLANVYYVDKNYDSSASYAKKALERDFTDFRPYMILGNINFVNNKLSEALQLLLEAKAKNPLSPEVHNSLGSIYDDMGKSGEAISSYKTAIRLRPDYFEAYTNIGVAYERGNNLTEAEQSLTRALSVNIGYVPAWYNLGVIYYKKNDKQGARRAFSEVVKLQPDHRDALTNLSVVCKEIGDERCYNDAMRQIKSQTTRVRQEK